MLEDLEAGRPLELEFLSGAVVRLGAARGVATPIHSMAVAALSMHARGR
jgi:2-dehydropantoate 2-reductase